MIDYKFKNIIQKNGKTVAVVVAYEGEFRDVEKINEETGEKTIINRYFRNKILWTREIETDSPEYSDLVAIANKEISLENKECLPIQVNNEIDEVNLSKLSYAKIDGAQRIEVAATFTEPISVDLEVAPDITTGTEIENATTTTKQM